MALGNGAPDVRAAYPDFSGGPPETRMLRDRLRFAMEKEGFTVFESEWWHFDYRDWREYPILNVPFGEIEEQRHPASAAGRCARPRRRRGRSAASAPTRHTTTTRGTCALPR
jgi:hypothetical protein